MAQQKAKSKSEVTQCHKPIKDFEVSIPPMVGWNNSEIGYSTDSQWV